MHRGCSGGALVNAETAELVGLITTNVKHQEGAIMPHVNFSLPAILLAPSLLDPLRGYTAAPAAPGALTALVETWSRQAADEREQALWRLEPEPLDLPSPVEARFICQDLTIISPSMISENP